MNTRRPPFGRSAALLVIAALWGAAHAQPAPQADSVSKASATAPAQPGLNRLIIQFKDQAVTRAGVFDFNAARGQLAALASSAAMARANSRVKKFAYLKSITAQSHVALTDKKLSRAELFALARQIAQDPRVAHVEIDEKVSAQFIPNDIVYPRQWHYHAPDSAPGGANLPAAWDSASGAGVVVAVLDTGYRPHADLAPNLLPGYDFVSEDGPGDFTTANDGDGRDSDASDPGDWHTSACDSGEPPSASTWHGTHVAGTLAAVTNNGVGVAGVAFGAKILPVRVLGVCGGYNSDVAAGMRWAAGLSVPGAPINPNKAKVLNLSLGGPGACSATYQDAVNAVRKAGSVVVAATGNDGAASVGYPANCAGVIAVTAHTRLGDNASYSNTGPETALSAPGGGTGRMHLPGDGGAIYSTLNSGSRTPAADSYGGEGWMGTSMAVPHVAGVAALLAGLQPAITPDAVRAVLLGSARSHPAGTYCTAPPHSAECGSGLLDARAAIERLGSPAPIVAVSVDQAGILRTGSVVTLQAQVLSNSPGGNARFSYEWHQVAGPAVSLNSMTSATPSFVAPVPGARYTFRVQVSDGAGWSASDQISVTTDTPPVLSPVAAQTVALGGKLTFTASASDAEGNPVVFVASSLPAGATLDAASGVFSWDGAGPAGTYAFTLTPDDGIFSGTPQSVSIVVTGPAASGGGGGGAAGWLEILGLLSLAGLGLRSDRLRGAQGVQQ